MILYVNNRYLLMLILFMIPVFTTPFFSQQDLEEQFQYSRDLFENEEYFDCVTELKRLLFFDSGKDYTYRANFMIAQSYKQGGKLGESIEYFSKSSMAAAGIEEKYLSEIEIIKINILRRTIPRAIQLIEELEQDNQYVEYHEEIRYWKGWAFIFNDEWDKAAIVFAEIDDEHPLKNLSEKVANEKYSVTFATLISYIVPGAGQFYTGNYFSGVLSFGWNLFFGYLTINSFIEERVFDALAVMNLLWFRFYSGNIQNAASFAEEKNSMINNRALDYLQHQYKGLKP